MPKKTGAAPEIVKVKVPIATEPKKRGRKPGVAYPKKAPATGARFGVFDDGAVELRLPKCSGSLEATEARELVEFLAKLGVKA